VNRSRLSSLAAAVAIVVPPVVAGTAQSAAAATTGSLAVTTLDREGTAGRQWIDVLDLATGQTSAWWQSGGEPLELPPGRYAVSATVWEGNGGGTLAGQIVGVTAGATSSVTFDARQGRPLRIGLDSAPDADYTQRLSARLCLGGVTSDFRTEVEEENGPLYVLPSADPQVRIGYATDWTAPDRTDLFAASGTVAADGEPVTIPRSSLGAVDIAVMRGPDSLNASTRPVRATLQGTGCEQGLQPAAAVVPLASRRVFHVNAGTWRFASGQWSGTRAVRAGDTSVMDFGHAVWGPVRYLPWLSGGSLGFFTSGMIADPSRDGVEPYIDAGATLYRDGRTVARQAHLGNYTSTSTRTFRAPVTTPAAYTLKVHAVRYRTGVTFPAGMMSRATDVSFSFHAGPASRAVAPGLLTRFLPSGRDLYNRASSDGPTTLTLALDRTATQPGVPLWPSTARKVEVFASVDGGQEWQPLAVTHRGTSWSAALPVQVPGSSISLSSRVTDTAGNTTVTTVYRALTATWIEL
jgi:hypothetical protein